MRLRFWTLGVAGCVLLAAAGPAQAECSQQDMEARAAIFEAALLAKVQRDPAAAKELVPQIQAMVAQVQAQAAENPEAACQAFDQLIAQLGG